MRIVELRVSGFARLVAVEIRPDGTLVPITGKNQQGKTSVLSAIWTALKGRAVAPPEPIHTGMERAVIRLDIGDAVVTRTFARGTAGELTTDLKVVAADGTRVTRKPQEWIDRTLAATCFNPLSFARAAPREQFDTLRQFVPGVDFDDMARQRQRLYDERTATNRRLADARALADSIVLPPGPEPDAVNTAELVAKLGAATEANSNRAATVAEIERVRLAANAQLDEAEKLRARAVSLERGAEQMLEDVANVEKTLPAKIDTAEITAALSSAESVQAVRNKFSERRRALADVERQDATADALTDAIDDLDRKRDGAIAAAQLPIAGLSFGADNVVLFNGVPFAQAGTAEKIRVSVAVGMALNPALRVLLIDEGSELDSESLAMIEQMAAERDFQVWLAKVDESGQVGFYIEDGRLKHADGTERAVAPQASADAERAAPV